MRILTFCWLLLTELCLCSGYLTFIFKAEIWAPILLLLISTIKKKKKGYYLNNLCTCFSWQSYDLLVLSLQFLGSGACCLHQCLCVVDASYWLSNIRAHSRFKWSLGSDVSKRGGIGDQLVHAGLRC